MADYVKLKIDSDSSSSSSSNNNSYSPKGIEARKGAKLESGPSSRERNVRLEKEEKDERDERDKNSSRGHHHDCEVEDTQHPYDTLETVTPHTAFPPPPPPQQPVYINNIASPNARLTLAMFEWVVCGGDPVLSSIDSIVLIALRDFQAILDFQNEVKDHHVGAIVSSKTQRRGSVGEKRSDVEDYSDSVHRGENPFIVPSEAYARMDCPQSVRTIIEILLISSQIYRKAGQ